MTDFFAQWQTLIGAAVGAFGAFTVAVFAYWLTRLSHRKDAAHVVYLELQMYKIAVSAYLDEVREIQDDIDHGRAAESDVSKYVEAVEKLRSVRPFLSPRLDAAMGTLYSSDLVLGVQLEGFRAAVAAAERAFASHRLERAQVARGQDQVEARRPPEPEPAHPRARERRKRDRQLPDRLELPVHANLPAHPLGLPRRPPLDHQAVTIEPEEPVHRLLGRGDLARGDDLVSAAKPKGQCGRRWHPSNPGANRCGAERCVPWAGAPRAALRASAL